MMEGSSSIVLHFVHRDTEREKVGPCMFLLCGTLLFKGGTQSNKESECPTLTYFCVFFFQVSLFSDSGIGTCQSLPSIFFHLFILLFNIYFTTTINIFYMINNLKFTCLDYILQVILTLGYAIKHIINSLRIK